MLIPAPAVSPVGPCKHHSFSLASLEGRLRKYEGMEEQQKALADKVDVLVFKLLNAQCAMLQAQSSADARIMTLLNGKIDANVAPQTGS